MVRTRDFVDANLYQSEEDVIQDALRHLLRARPDLRGRLAVHRYETETLSIAKAASLAGVSWAQMKDILMEHHVPLRLGAETLEEAEQEAQTLRRGVCSLSQANIWLDQMIKQGYHAPVTDLTPLIEPE